jgi:hypothetical protein
MRSPVEHGRDRPVAPENDSARSSVSKMNGGRQPVRTWSPRSSGLVRIGVEAAHLAHRLERRDGLADRAAPPGRSMNVR